MIEVTLVLAGLLATDPAVKLVASVAAPAAPVSLKAVCETDPWGLCEDESATLSAAQAGLSPECRAELARAAADVATAVEVSSRKLGPEGAKLAKSLLAAALERERASVELCTPDTTSSEDPFEATPFPAKRWPAAPDDGPRTAQEDAGQSAVEPPPAIHLFDGLVSP